MKYELAGIKDGVELYNPVPEDEHDERVIKMHRDIFCDTLAKMIIKYGPKLLEERAKKLDHGEDVTD